MNGVDFPVAKVLDGHRRGARGRPRPGQGQRRPEARRERRRHPADGPLGARRGPHPPVHRVHGRRDDERLAPRRRRAGGGGRGHDRSASGRSRPRRRATAARSPSAGATPTAAARSGSSRRSPSRSAATAPAPASRPRASCTRACSAPSGTTCATRCAPAPRTRTSRALVERPVGRPRRSLLGAPLGGHEPPAARSRCSPSAADRPRRPRAGPTTFAARVVHRLSTVSTTRGHGGRPGTKTRG